MCCCFCFLKAWCFFLQGVRCVTNMLRSTRGSEHGHASQIGSRCFERVAFEIVPVLAARRPPHAPTPSVHRVAKYTSSSGVCCVWRCRAKGTMRYKLKVYYGPPHETNEALSMPRLRAGKAATTPQPPRQCIKMAWVQNCCQSAMGHNGEQATTME